MAAIGNGASLNCGSFLAESTRLFRLPTLSPRNVRKVGNDHAFLPQSNYRRHRFAHAHLASDCDPSYHLSRVSESIKTKDEAEECGQDVRAPIIAIVGLTASGKSDPRIGLSRRISG